MNSIMAENFIRSANAPAIRAGVMIAKVIWKVMNTDSGMVPASACVDSKVIPERNALLNPPTN